MSRGEVRPDRLDALLSEIIALRDEGDAERFEQDHRYRWLLHRLWIAVGNEALAYTVAVNRPVRNLPPWANLYELRNQLAHHRLPDIDDALVRRTTWLSCEQLRDHVREILRGAGWLVTSQAPAADQVDDLRQSR